MMTDLKSAAAALSGLCGEGAGVLAAVSGGLDSMCLLHLLTHWGQAQGLQVTAAHFNHRLRGENADRDEAFVRQICTQWGVPLVCGSGDVRALAEEAGLSVEEAARNLRYDFLEQHRAALNCTCILTAHHADDHAETILLNLLRGTGARGLAGIPAVREQIFRPFLGITRAELEIYAKTHSIPHVEDETNAQLDATRNVLRHKVLPVLRELNPRAVENMARTAELLAADDDALTAQAEKLLRSCGSVTEHGAELKVSACEEAPPAVVSRALLMLMSQVAASRRDLSRTHVAAAQALLETGCAGQTVSLPYGMTALRTADGLRIQRQTTPLPREAALQVGQSVTFGHWIVTLSDAPQAGAYAYPLSLPEGADLSVSGWHSADRMSLPGSRGSRTLKRLAADRGISPAERDRLPVLRVNHRPAAVPGIGVDTEFTPNGEETAVLVTFLKQTEENHHEK